MAMIYNKLNNFLKYYLNNNLFRFLHFLIKEDITNQSVLTQMNIKVKLMFLATTKRK